MVLEKREGNLFLSPALRLLSPPRPSSFLEIFSWPVTDYSTNLVYGDKLLVGTSPAKTPLRKIPERLAAIPDCNARRGNCGVVSMYAQAASGASYTCRKFPEWSIAWLFVAKTPGDEIIVTSKIACSLPAAAHGPCLARRAAVVGTPLSRHMHTANFFERETFIGWVFR